MRFLRPLPVLPGELFHQSLVLGSQVILFRPVPDVVNLPGTPVGSHQLEFVRQGSAVSLVLPEDGAGRAGVGNTVPYLFRRNGSGFGPIGVERLAVHVAGDGQFGPGEAGGAMSWSRNGE